MSTLIKGDGQPDRSSHKLRRLQLNRTNWVLTVIGIGLLVGASYLWQYSWTYLILVFFAGCALSSPIRYQQDKFGKKAKNNDS